MVLTTGFCCGGGGGGLIWLWFLVAGFPCVALAALELLCRPSPPTQERFASLSPEYWDLRHVPPLPR